MKTLIRPSTLSIPFLHPMTGERLYTPEEVDYLLSLRIQENCEKLRKDIHRQHAVPKQPMYA